MRDVRISSGRRIEASRSEAVSSVFAGLALLACAALAVTVSACDSPLVPDTDADITGDVVATGAGIRVGVDFVIHVKAEPEDQCGIHVIVGDDTDVVDSRGGPPRRASRDILVVGATVAVWTTGIILDSCPGIADGTVVDRRE